MFVLFLRARNILPSGDRSPQDQISGSRVIIHRFLRHHEEKQEARPPNCESEELRLSPMCLDSRFYKDSVEGGLWRSSLMDAADWLTFNGPVCLLLDCFFCLSNCVLEVNSSRGLFGTPKTHRHTHQTCSLKIHAEFGLHSFQAPNTVNLNPPNMSLAHHTAGCVAWRSPSF